MNKQVFMILGTLTMVVTGTVSLHLFNDQVSAPHPVTATTTVENNSAASTKPNDSALSIRLAKLETQVLALQASIDEINKLEPETKMLSIALTPNNRPLNFNNQNQPNILQNLLASGIDASLAERLSQQQNDNDLAQLVLRDKAIREGYLGAPQFREEMRAIATNDISIRDELNDEQFDRFLYAAGQANRIGIASVMSGSAAEIAGIENGDFIVSYAGKRLFNWNELQTMTTAGEYGEFVDITIQRDGNKLSLTMPRGPLGVRLNQIRVDPKS